MSSLEAEPRRRFLDFGITGVAAGALVAVAAAFIVLAPRFDGESTFSPRGQPATSSARFGVDFYVQRGSTSTKLEAGATVSHDAGFAFIVRTVRPIEFMLFGRDSKGDIHWFYPAFNDADADPLSLHLSNSSALPEAVSPEDASAGRFELIGLFSEAALHVSHIERLIVDAGVERLRRMPGVEVETLEVHRQ